MENLESVLLEWADGVINKIKHNLDATGTTTTGKTKESLHARKYDEAGYNLVIEGRPFFQSVETGRTPTVNSQDIDLVSILAKWIKDKKLDVQWGLDKPYQIRSAAYGIFLKHKYYGSKLYRDGGRTDIYTQVLDEELPKLNEKITGVILKDIREETVEKMRREFERLNKEK